MRSDVGKTKTPLVNELQEMRRRTAALEASEAKRERAEEALRETEEKYRSMVESAGDAIVSSGSAGSIISWNRKAEAMFGYSSDEIVGRPLTTIMPERFRKAHQKAINRVASAGEPAIVGRTVELAGLRKDGSEFPVEVSLAAWQTGEAVSFTAVIRDVTERKQAKEALRESEERYSRLFHESRDAVYVTTRRGRFVEVNQSMLDLFGYTRDGMMKLRVSQIYAHPEHRRRFQRKIEKEGAVKEYELRLRRNDGAEMDCLVTSSVRRDEDGNILGYQGIIRDITERKRMAEELEQYSQHLEEMVAERTRELRDAQEELVRQERLATLGQVSGSISHELRNPLGAIDGSAYYLKMRLGDADEKVQEHLGRIRSGVRSATAIIESLLDLTRMGALQLKGHDLVALTHDTIATFNVPPAVSVVRDFPAQAVPVAADRKQLSMAFHNVMDNAVEAMDGKGTLRVTVRIAADGRAEVSFADAGPGIAPENLDRVFQPLFSTKVRGIGFGLSIAQTVVDRHGGTITAESEPGRGATITIRLPAPVAKKDGEA